MYRSAERSFNFGNQLAPKYVLANRNDWLRRIAGMLLDRQYELIRNRDLQYRFCC